METEALLEARGLVKAYRRGGWLRGRTLPILRGVDLKISEGRLAVVGPSGCGKSTLARCLALFERPDGGSLRFLGRDVRGLPAAQRRLQRRRIQLILQDAAQALNPRFTVTECVAEPLRLARRGSRPEQRQRALELLGEVGIPPSAADRRPLELSGGQRQRVVLARALAAEPDLLILDEALAGLDLSVQARIVNLLLDLADRTGLSYLHISHDLSMVRYLADRVAVMDRGRIVELRQTEAFFAEPRHPVSRRLLAASAPLRPRPASGRRPQGSEGPWA